MLFFPCFPRLAKDDARKRAVAAPRLGGARITELSRPHDHAQAPAATFAPAPPPTRARKDSGRSALDALVVSSTLSSGGDAKKNSPGGKGGRGELRKLPQGPIPGRRAHQRPAAAAGRGGTRGSPGGPYGGSGSATRRVGGATKPPTSRGAAGRVSSGSRSGGGSVGSSSGGVGKAGGVEAGGGKAIKVKAGSAKKGGSGARGGGGVVGMGVMDILKAMDDSWRDGDGRK